MNFEANNALDGDIKIDILVIGAGMAGILTAFLLQEQGNRVAVIEAKTVAAGVTKNTTAKITSQHSLIYNKLINNFGEKKAYQYANLNQTAIKKYEEIIKKYKIDCDFEKKNNFVYTKNDIKKIEDEIAACRKLGIDAEFKKITELPFKVLGGIMFPEQAQFNPLKFIEAVSKRLTVYENTKAETIEDYVVYTNKGKIRANKIVVATHYPFINAPGYYFLRMHQERSYALGLLNAAQVYGMYIDADSSGYSFRNYNDYLIFGGGGRRTGKEKEDSGYAGLIRAAKQYYPQCEIEYKWSTQDCVTFDGVPFIGRYSNSKRNLYVATGFKKWGMTSSMAAAIILEDLINKRKTVAADIFLPQRFNIKASIGTLLGDTGQSVAGLTKTYFYTPNKAADKLTAGEAGIVKAGRKKVGVYKDENGKAHYVSTKCPHLGCQLEWNKDDLSWDCPCHGSRFNIDGQLLDNPAMKRIH